jgi:hypothetical protein
MPTAARPWSLLQAKAHATANRDRQQQRTTRMKGADREAQTLFHLVPSFPRPSAVLLLLSG